MAQKYRFSQVRDRKGVVFASFYIAVDRLPRQARDKRTGKALTKRHSIRSRLRAGAGVGARAGAAGGRDAHAVREPMCDVAGTKTHLLRCRLILESIVLPRQARDKHRERALKVRDDAFSSYSTCPRWRRRCRSSAAASASAPRLPAATCRTSWNQCTWLLRGIHIICNTSSEIQTGWSPRSERSV